MIRATIRKGSNRWTFVLTEDVGDDATPFIAGAADTWREARDAALGELRIFYGRPRQQLPPLVSPVARERSWLTRVLCGANR
jgi:hypothetical protein